MPPALDWPSWTYWVIGTAAVLAALGVIGRFLWQAGKGVRTFSGWIRAEVVDVITAVVREHALSPEQVANLVTEIVEAKLAPIHAEVRPNGGASLKDQVTQIQKTLDAHMASSAQDRSELRDRIEQGGGR